MYIRLKPHIVEAFFISERKYNETIQSNNLGNNPGNVTNHDELSQGEQ